MSALRLDLEWRTTLLTLLLVPALVALGFWQLDRAEEKTLIAAQDARRAAAPAQPFAALQDMSDQELAYRRVELQGEFLPDAVLLLDNQIRDGRYGHDVYGVFQTSVSGALLLLNRGWVPGDASRRSLPEVTVPVGPLRLSAVLYVPPGEPYLLAEDRFASLDWPLLVQSASASALAEALESEFAQPVFRHELRLLPDQPGGFRRDWPVINVSPQKHRGYAVQWFTMAAALLLFFVFRSSNVLALLRGSAEKES